MLVACHEVEFSYGKQFALQGVSFSLTEGCTGLLGPNGAGKSTLIKCLLGQLPQAAGRVEVLGLDVAKQPLAVRQRVGYMPEAEAQIPGMTGLEMTVLCARLCGLPRAEATSRAHRVLFYVNLGEERYRAAEGYSTGMRQKLKLACALVHGPRLLLLDEPTSGLDPRGREHMLELIRDLGRRGVSVFFSSHILRDLEGVCERLVVLAEGRLVFAGTREEFQHRQSSRLRVRVKEGAPRLAEALATAGCRVESTQGSTTLELSLPENGQPQLVWLIAARLGLQVRHLAPVTMNIEEAFEKAVSERAPGRRA